MLTVRPEVVAATDFSKKPSEYTLREAVEWFKRCVRLNIAPTKAETDLLDSRWSVLAQAMADRESVPAGYLSYMLSELGQMELRMGEVASAEAEAAVEEARAAVRAVEEAL